MKFTDLDSRMRVYETTNDLRALPGLYLVARIDGRNFTRLTKEAHAFETPFDERFRDMMVATTKHLMTCGFRVTYGYTESDEISLLLALDEDTFGRKLRKYNSVLAGEASAAFSLLLGDHGAFDCRICQLPTVELVVDYFRWRSEDAFRNALNSHCYWALRRAGATARQATRQLDGTSVADKNELLFAHGINFNNVPAWEKRGVGLYWEEVEQEGRNPKTGESTLSRRRECTIDLELPLREEYAGLVRRLAR